MNTNDSPPVQLIGTRIAETARRWRQLLDERSRDTGLSQARWLVLLHLSRLGDGISQTSLAQSIGIEGASLVRLLDDLESRNLVERRIDPQDRRAKHLLLTSAGRLALNDVDAIAATVRQALLLGLDEHAIAHLLAMLDQILANAARLTRKPCNPDDLEEKTP